MSCFDTSLSLHVGIHLTTIKRKQLSRMSTRQWPEIRDGNPSPTIFFLKYDARHCVASVYSAVLQPSAQTVTFPAVANRREQVITASDV